MTIPGRAPFVLLCTLVAAGCDPSLRTQAARGCAQPVIVAFAAAPNDALFTELERTSGARLEERASLTSVLYSITVVADGPDCSAAVEQLRRDERVRSVDLDARRRLHPPGSTVQE